MVQINEFVKRARSAKIHAYIISHLKKEMPAIMGKAKAQQKLIDNLDVEFAKVSPSQLNPSFLGCLISLLLIIFVLQNRFKGSIIYQLVIFPM